MKIKKNCRRPDSFGIVCLENGFEIDFFKTDSGNLGMTISFGDVTDDDNNFVDVYVNKNLRITHF